MSSTIIITVILILLCSRFSGMWVLLILSAAFCYAFYRGCPLDFFHKHYLQFVTASITFSVVAATATFVYWRNCPLVDRSPAADGTYNAFVSGHGKILGK